MKAKKKNLISKTDLIAFRVCTWNKKKSSNALHVFLRVEQIEANFAFD